MASARPRQAYLLAIAATAATLGARVALDAAFRGFPGLLLFSLPIFASAYFGGLRGGLLATVLACFASEYLTLLPLRPIVFDAESYRWMQVFLAVGGLAISVLTEGLHRARERARELARAREAVQEELRRDVTERTAALEAHRELAQQLAREKGRLLAAQAVAKVGSWETDVASGAVEWSQETHRIFGTLPAEFAPTHREFLARVHPDDRAAVQAAFSTSLEAGAEYAIEHRIVLADGAVKTVEERWRASVDGEGRATRVLGTCQDVSERKAAAQVLAAMSHHTLQRERILSTMLASISDFAYIFDREGRFLFVNQPLLDLWGIPLEQAVGRNFGELGYAPALAAGLEKQLRHVLETGESVTDETEYVSPAGVAGSYEYIFSPVIGADGSVELVVGSTRDMTGRKHAERALVEAEAKYRSLFENSAEGIFQNTPDGRMLAANPALAAMLGFDSPDELVSTRVDLEMQSYAHPSERDQFRARLEREGAINGFECEVRRKDGTRIWVSENVRVVRAEDGSPLRYEGSVQDITERRRAEEALQESNLALRRQSAELRVLFDLMPAMIWFKDPDNRILRINQRAALAAGLPIGEIEGRLSVEIYPRDAGTHHADDMEVIASGVPRLGLVERRADSGADESWVETDRVPYFDDDGKVAGVVVMAQDISERKRSETQLRKTNNQLIEVSRLGGMAEVATDVLHNVGNILNSVNVSAALVVENVRNSRASRMADVVALLREHRDDLARYITTDPAGQHIPEMLEALSREWVGQQQLLVTELEELHRNVDLIKTVIASQQSHAGAAEIVESMGVAELVEDAVRVQQDVLSKQQVRVVRDFATVPPIRVVRHKAIGILVSLLRNGRQACRNLEPQARCITLTIERRGSRAAIRVGDNGDGIAAENLVRIFAPGFTTRDDARGYGLHSAALAAAELGGGLTAASDGPGLGATFTLELPLRQDAVAA
jgi:PAS domain S-box-containing protein